MGSDSVNDSDTPRDNIPDMEDYGDPATGQEAPGAQRPAGSAQERYGGSHSGGYSGGTEGVREGSSEGLQFGEYLDTDTGTDLTRSMETHPLPPEGAEPAPRGDLAGEMQPDDLNPRTGLVKGGEHGHDAAGGPARYGGDTGALGQDGEGLTG